MDYHKNNDMLSYNAIVKALLENYESIYAVDVETSAYKCFYESDSYSMLRLQNSGDNFFDSIEENIFTTIYLEDQEFVRSKLTKQALLFAIAKSQSLAKKFLKASTGCWSLS